MKGEIKINKKLKSSLLTTSAIGLLAYTPYIVAMQNDIPPAPPPPAVNPSQNDTPQTPSRNLLEEIREKN